MVKTNLTIGLGKQALEIYNVAKNNNCWIGYMKKWYTPEEFAKQLGHYEINMAELDVSHPKDLLRKGREAFERLIRNNAPQEQILEALHRLNAFTDKFWLKCRPEPWDIERGSLSVSAGKE